MSRFTTLFTILLVFASFATSTPLKRDDSLSGFKQCDGNFPNTVTLFNFNPYPAVVGDVVHIHFAGKANDIVEKEAVMNVIGYYNNKQAFHNVIDYCELFVKHSGSKCPVGKGDFDFTANWLIPLGPSDPKNVEIEFDMEVNVENPDGKMLSCLVGKSKVIYP